jgi:hypothetical protein
MIQVDPASIGVSGPAERTRRAFRDDLGLVTLRGEIVDSKCYFGVMNPGRGKVHRDCAVRCISGGVPPALLVKHQDGNLRTILLTGSDGQPLGQEVLEYVAEPLAVTGRLAVINSELVLKTEPRAFTRE